MSDSIAENALRAREVLYRHVRDFFLSEQFSSQNIIEVETSLFPLSLSTDQSACFQISKHIRNEPIDRRHCTEFSVLQWRQSNWTGVQVLSDVDSLLMAIFSGEFEPERRTFRQVFIQRLGFDPDELTVAELKQEARRLGLRESLGEDRLAWLKLMFVHFIEPTLGIDIPLYLTDLPSQWRDTQHDGEASFQSHTDIYIDGIKVGSVLIEKLDIAESSQQRSSYSYVVFGLDRLLMIILETRQIQKVLGVDLSSKIEIRAAEQ